MAQAGALELERPGRQVELQVRGTVEPGSDILQIQRLKKRKLALRDRISFIEDQLTPDIIA